MTIVTGLRGGLGNQLFQYAAGRRLSVVHETMLKMDVSSFTNSNRKYDLSHFSIQENFATAQEVAALKTSGAYIKEPPFDCGHKETLLKTPRDVYLDGYWQNESYFADIAELIAEEFTAKFALSLDAARKLEAIQKTESVSIHVRRADYTYPKVQRRQGLLDIEYYKTCVQQISERLIEPHLFVFSDDPRWAHRHLRVPYPTTFISNRRSKNYEDLLMMSMCKHNIIANSSFSWWGAWLNRNPNKLVIAPTRWAAGYQRDVVPRGWIKVNNDYVIHPYSGVFTELKDLGSSLLRRSHIRNR